MKSCNSDYLKYNVRNDFVVYILCLLVYVFLCLIMVSLHRKFCCVFHSSKVFICFSFQDWFFDDGAAPPRELVERWLKLLKERFSEDPGTTIAIHCVAGLGR